MDDCFNELAVLMSYFAVVDRRLKWGVMAMYYCVLRRLASCFVVNHPLRGCGDDNVLISLLGQRDGTGEGGQFAGTVERKSQRRSYIF